MCCAAHVHGEFVVHGALCTVIWVQCECVVLYMCIGNVLCIVYCTFFSADENPIVASGEGWFVSITPYYGVYQYTLQYIHSNRYTF